MQSDIKILDIRTNTVIIRCSTDALRSRDLGMWVKQMGGFAEFVETHTIG